MPQLVQSIIFKALWRINQAILFMEKLAKMAYYKPKWFAYTFKKYAPKDHSRYLPTYTRHVDSITSYITNSIN